MRRIQLHRSSIVVGLLVAIALILIEVPGRVGIGEWTGRWPGVHYLEHGWPSVYLRREIQVAGGGTIPPSLASVRTDLPRLGIPWLSGPNWRLWEADEDRWQFHLTTIVADALAACAVLVIVIALWEWRRRRRPKLLSFGLADLMVLMTLAGLVLGWVVYQKQEFERERDIVNQEMLRVDSGLGWEVIHEECVAPRWLQSLTGPKAFPNFLWRPYGIYILSREPNLEQFEVIQRLAQLKRVREIAVNDDIEHLNLAILQSLTNVEVVQFDNWTNNQALDQIAKFRQVRKVVLSDLSAWAEMPVADAVAYLQDRMPWCKVVALDDDW